MPNHNPITELADALARQINPKSMGKERSISHFLCNFCNGPACQFTDAISEKEYHISGICQKCQDAVFGPPEE